jgi:hypothetical protein
MAVCVNQRWNALEYNSSIAFPVLGARAKLALPFYTLDPLSDSRWDHLVDSHPQASVFHRGGWLQALARTYGYKPLALTSSPPGSPLADGLAFCEIRSWITGGRLVSLPFADHCEPLLSESCGASLLSDWMRNQCHDRKWQYIEFRPHSSQLITDLQLPVSQTFWLHTLDLSPSLAQISSRLHGSCIQRRIRHALREQLTCDRGRSEEFLTAFYHLLLITRRRHGLLPQPRSWFRNLIDCLSPDVEIRLVRKNGEPVAAIMTLRHRRTVVYKYGCSDERFHHLGAMPFLFWRLIEESKAEGAEQIDLGRTDLANETLARFKDRLGAARKRLHYSRYSSRVLEKSPLGSGSSAVRAIFAALPDALSSTMGRMVYRHIG